MNDSKNGYEVMGLMLPQAKDVEQVILGACMLDKGALISALSIMDSEMFYDGFNGAIFKAIKHLSDQNKPVDIITVVSELKENKQLPESGAWYISGLTDHVSSVANIEYHCRIVQQKYLSRKLIEICHKTAKEAYEDVCDILELLNDTAKKIINLQQIESTSIIEADGRIVGSMAKIITATTSGNTTTGIPSKLQGLDKIIGGWQNQDLIVIAGRPGAGKSAVAINFAINAGVPVYMFSLEMSDVQIGMRELGMLSNIKYSKLNRGEINHMDYNHVVTVSEIAKNRPFYVDSSSKLNISILRTKIIKAINEKGIKLVIIDYLNLMGSESRSINMADKISEIVMEIKRMAKQFEIPIILLAQLSREVEKEGDKRPKLHHLKSSGAIEEYSDIVLLLYRPAYYYKESKPGDEPNTLYIDIAKHKQGAVGEVKVFCEIEKNLISDFPELF